MQFNSLCSVPLSFAKFSVFVVLLAVDGSSSSPESDEQLDSQVAFSRRRRSDNDYYHVLPTDGSDLMLKRAQDWQSTYSSMAKRAPGWGKRSQFSGLSSAEAAHDLMAKRGWGKRSWGKSAAEEDETEDVDMKRAPGWGKRAPGWGKRAPGWGKRAPGWGKRAPGWGKRGADFEKRAPGWGKRSSDLDFCETLDSIVDNLIYKAVEYDSQRLLNCGSDEETGPVTRK